MSDKSFQNLAPLIDRLKNSKKPENLQNQLEDIATKSLKWDGRLKICILIIFIVYIIYQTHAIHSFIALQFSYPTSHQINPQILITYIKYALGFNSAILLVLGYWFGSNGAFSKMIHSIISKAK